jgi:hypothetical protein
MSAVVAGRFRWDGQPDVMFPSHHDEAGRPTRAGRRYSVMAAMAAAISSWTGSGGAD